MKPTRMKARQTNSPAICEESLELEKWKKETDIKVKGKRSGTLIALLHDEHMLRSALQSRMWQLIGMS